MIEESWYELLRGNERFRLGRPEPRRYAQEHLRELAIGQHPIAAILCCSDSRVCPEVVFDQPLGKLFVVRSAGNTASPEALGSFEFALEHLGVGLFVVLGHTRCGAVTAALEVPKPSGALSVIWNGVRRSIERVPDDAPDRATALAEHNVRATLEAFVEQSQALRQAVANRTASLIGAMYDIENGRVSLLP